MEDFYANFNSVMSAINTAIWNPYMLYVLVGMGIVFTLATAFGQYWALKHGTAVLRGRYDSKDGPGAISHFQALSAALSATVGLGNIGGVAIALAVGGPGAIFWMWIIGFVGMTLKMVEVTLSMLYRNTDDPDNPSGGPMWVASKAMQEFGGAGSITGKVIGGLFCICLILSAFTAGNFFQSWNVGEITAKYLPVEQLWVGVVLAVLVGVTILGGIKRIGVVAGFLVPFMCAIYVVAGIVVLVINHAAIPASFGLIFDGAFGDIDASGAFLGATAGWGFIMGMKRAIFSSEAGMGSAPIAHSAVKTNEPVREGIVAGLEPFIDTLVVCTISALVILTSGVWQRGPVTELPANPAMVQIKASQAEKAEDEEAKPKWQLSQSQLPARADQKAWKAGTKVFMVAAAETDENQGNNLVRVDGKVILADDGARYIQWQAVESKQALHLRSNEVFEAYPGATLTARAFDLAWDGLGAVVVTLAVWLFAFSTMISWCYYGEQGVKYLFGQYGIYPYRLLYVGMVAFACAGIVTDDKGLDAVSTFGTGMMVYVNILIMALFGKKAIEAYHRYIRRLRAGEFE